MFGGMELHDDAATVPTDTLPQEEEEDAGMFDGMMDTGMQDAGDALGDPTPDYGGGNDDGGDLHGLGQVDYTPTKHDKLQQLISELSRQSQDVSTKLQGCRSQRQVWVWVGG